MADEDMTGRTLRLAKAEWQAEAIRAFTRALLSEEAIEAAWGARPLGAETEEEEIADMRTAIEAAVNVAIAAGWTGERS